MVISMNDFGSLNLNEIVSGMKDIFAMGKIDLEANRIGSEFSEVINKFMEDRMRIKVKNSRQR